MNKEKHNCSLCLNDYEDHESSDQLCKRCFKDVLNFKDLEDTYVYPLKESA